MVAMRRDLYFGLSHSTICSYFRGPASVPVRPDALYKHNGGRMRLRVLAVSLSCLVAVNAGGQASKSQAGKSPELRIDFTRETLPNGLNVIYHVDHSTPVAAVLLWYNVGSKMEQPGRT